MNLKLIDTFAFPNAENQTYLTTEQKVNKAKTLRKYQFEVIYNVCKDLNNDYCRVEVWGEI